MTADAVFIVFACV